MAKYIPAPLIAEILSRLPVKSLKRFRCVSKLWLSMIEDPQFIKLHLKQSKLSLVLRAKDLCSVDFPTLKRGLKIDHPLKSSSCLTDLKGSCNGLLCLSNGDDDDQEGSIIFNPATREHRKVPFSPVEYPEGEDGYVMYCENWVSGFGYDHVNDDYKLVWIIQVNVGTTVLYESEIKVYSLKSNSWKRVENMSPELLLAYKSAIGEYVNGCLHWIVRNVTDPNGSQSIIAFDLVSETFKEYQLPAQLRRRSGGLHINVGVLGGCLYMICSYAFSKTDVWIMKEYGVKESWVKLFSVVQGTNNIGIFSHVRPIAYSEDGSCVLLEQDSKHFVWFDLRRKRFKRVTVNDLPEKFQAMLMVESLVPLATHNKKKKRKPKNKRNKESMQAGSSLAVLPLSVLRDILSRLPAKTLLQLRCVCRAWNDLIGDPYFARMQVNVSGQSYDNLNLIIRGEPENNLYVIDLSLPVKTVKIDHPLSLLSGLTDFVGTCNGLLCLTNNNDYVTIWNPLTGCWYEVPSAKMLPLTSTRVMQYLFIFGFGYDSLTDDYKVVHIVQVYDNSSHGYDYDVDGFRDFEDDDFLDSEGDSFVRSEVQVYSLRTKNWRRVQYFPFVLCYSCEGVLASGALHWLARRRHEMDSTSYVIIAFDVHSEQCTEIRQPEYEDKHFHMSLGLLGQCLCILCHYPKCRADIWVMKNYETCSWEKLISVTQPRPIKFFEYIKPLIFSKNGSEVLLDQDYEKLIWYNLQKKTIRPANICDLPSSFGSEVFSASLIDPSNLGGNSEMFQQWLNGSRILSHENWRNDSRLSQKQLEVHFCNRLEVLPEKLCCHILSRLPVKTLLQAQCVCKRWFNLINNPEFIKMHLDVSSKCKSGLSLIVKADGVLSIDLQHLDEAILVKHPLFSDGGLTEIVGSSNGLICLLKDKDFALWNPSTCKYEDVPFADLQLLHTSKAFNCFIHGFGHDPTTDDYMIVCVLQQHNRMKGGKFHTEFQVYSLKNKTWGSRQSLPFYICSPCAGVFASGALHWVACESPYLYKNSNMIIAYDLGSQNCRVLTQPNYVYTDFHMSLALLQGRLCLLCHYPEHSTVDMWVMTDYETESWTKLISISQHDVTNGFQYLKPLVYSQDGTEVLLEQDNQKLLWYNLKKKTLKYVRDLRVQGVPKSFETFVCPASLVPVGNSTKTYHAIPEQTSKENHSRKDKKDRDELKGFLSKGFKLKL